jgi:rod shape-determining protein MreC
MLRDTYTPLQSGLSSLRLNWAGLTAAFSDKQTQNRKLENLSQENQRLKIENQVLTEYKYEALRLQKILDFQKQNNDGFEFVAARVIARSPNNWYNYLVIDRGLEDGIEKDMPVISPQGLVGRVATVSRNSAQVTLITDREMAVGAIVQKNREAKGIVEGLGKNTSLSMANIPYYSSIRKGDQIITSGLSSLYPKGIVIGKVNSISKEPSGLLLLARVKPAVDFDKLEEVLVISNYESVVENVEAEEE